MSSSYAVHFLLRETHTRNLFFHANRFIYICKRPSCVFLLFLSLPVFYEAVKNVKKTTNSRGRENAVSTGRQTEIMVKKIRIAKRPQNVLCARPRAPSSTRPNVAPGAVHYYHKKRQRRKKSVRTTTIDDIFRVQLRTYITYSNSFQHKDC